MHLKYISILLVYGNILYSCQPRNAASSKCSLPSITINSLSIYWLRHVFKSIPLLWKSFNDPYNHSELYLVRAPFLFWAGLGEGVSQPFCQLFSLLSCLIHARHNLRRRSSMFKNMPFLRVEDALLWSREASSLRIYVTSWFVVCYKVVFKR